MLDFAGAATWLLVATAGATALVMLAIAGVRVVTTLRRRRGSRAHRTAMELVLRITDGEAVPVPTTRRLADALALAAAKTVHKVRGADRQALADWLVEAGFQDSALELMSARRATRRARGIELYLAATSGAAPGPVVPMLRDPHPGVRAAAVRALGASGARDAVPALVAAIGARRRPISASAATMAIVDAAPSSSASLDAAWRSDDPRIRRIAADISGYLELADARAELERALTARDVRLRTHAALALGRIGSPSSIWALRTALRDADPGSPEAHALRGAITAVQATPGEEAGG